MSVVGVQADRQPAPHAPLPLARERGGRNSHYNPQEAQKDVYVVVFGRYALSPVGDMHLL